MEINDEHRGGNVYAIQTMADGEPGKSQMFGTVNNATEPASHLQNAATTAYHWNNSIGTLPVLNITEATVINLWKLTNGSESLSRHLANETHLGWGQPLNQWEQWESFNQTLTSSINSRNALANLNGSLEVKEVLTWWDVWLGKPFPSGYTQLAVVILAFFLVCIMILVVVGNLLVCIAIATEKSLKPVQNWFIASLAVSDLLIGLVIMPFSLARELMGYWVFGQVFCDVHAALDVLLCTASINSLFLISLDRFWSITQAVKYLKKRTPSRAAFMIAFVWIFSALVSLPPLVGWKKAEQSSQYPQCNLSDDISYVIYSSVGSFYFPALMMVFVYIRIFIAARSRARKHIEKKRLKIPIESHPDVLKEKSYSTTMGTSFSNPSPPEKLNKDQVPRGCAKLGAASLTCAVKVTECPNEGSETASFKAHLPKSPPPQIVIEASPDSRRQSWNIISTSELISSISIIGDPLMTPGLTPTQPVEGVCSREDNGNSQSVSSTNENSDCEQSEQGQAVAPEKSTKVYFLRLKSAKKVFRFRKPRLNGLSKSNSISKSVTVDDDSDTADSPTSKEPPNFESKAFLSAPKLLRSKFGSSLSIADYEDSDLMEDEKKRGKGGRVQYHDPPVVGIHIPTDAERHKRKIAKARERRATLIVGLIMAAFITAWLPFFVLYVMAALCVSCKENIPEGVFAVAFWLGYCNSGKF